MSANAKGQLVEFLKRRAFDPVLRAKADDVPQAKRVRLEHVQKATRSEIERFENYGSADEVVTNFKRDLHSAAAKKVHAELRDLGLPTIDDIREEFEGLVEKLGVKA